MKKLTFPKNTVLGLITVMLIVLMFSFKNNNEPVITYDTPPMPGKLSFAGENVPLDRWDVKERLDREVLFNYYNQANVLFLLRLANRYFPVIEERLKAKGIH